MTIIRPLWPRSCLNSLPSSSSTCSSTSPSLAAPPRCGPPARSRHQPLNRRHLASQATPTSPTPQRRRFAEFMPPRDRTELDILLHAIQRRDVSRISEAFVAWTDVLGDTESPSHQAALRQAHELPGPTFSEILRCLDPVLASGHDVAHGLNLTPGQIQFTDAGKLVDEFGVRDIHRRILAGMHILIAVRGGSRHGLVPADFEVSMRCAGAAVDYHGAKTFWSSMAAHGLQDSRTAQSWSEFIKARFMIEPLYYQFDRSRVAVLARDLYSNRTPLPMATIKRLDRVRLSLNAMKKQPWNRRPDELDEDMRRLFRRRVDYRGYKGHWIRALYYGHEMDEELLCTSMIAFARSSSLHSIKTMILKNYYDITIDESTTPGNPQISGGRDFPLDSLIKPTPRLLHAIVEAFGSMSHISLGAKLLDFISRRYDMPIPHETWSNLLSWTYLCASKPFRPMRKLHGAWKSTVVSAADVRQIWDVMTSEPYNVSPTFEDLDVYIKTLIIQRSFGRAIQVIREHVMPYYADLVLEYENAMFDEILQNDASLSTPSLWPSPLAARRRKQAEIRKDYAHHRISAWFEKLLKTASSNRGHREGSVMQTLVPDLIREFSDFFQPDIRYRTSQGVVQLHRPHATPRFEWTRRWRTTLPQKKAGIYVRDFDGSDESEFPYPEVPTMRVLEWQRRPQRRPKSLGTAPIAPRVESKEWWDKLEKQLMV